MIVITGDTIGFYEKYGFQKCCEFLNRLLNGIGKG
jgi:ribosomal protein S18 acetylase RimI-like enzyme